MLHTGENASRMVRCTMQPVRKRFTREAFATNLPILDITSKPSCASLVQAAAAHQTRGHKRPTVVSEFSHVVDLELPSLPQVNAKQRLRHAVRHVPAGSKLLMYSLKGVEGNRSFCCKFGCYKSKAQFVADAVVASHPFFDSLPLPDSSKRALFTLLVKGPAWVASFRAKTMSKWTEWALRARWEQECLWHFCNRT